MLLLGFPDTEHLVDNLRIRCQIHFIGFTVHRLVDTPLTAMKSSISDATRRIVVQLPPDAWSVDVVPLMDTADNKPAGLH